MSQKLFPINGGFSLRMALEVMSRDPGVERVEIVDFEDSHVTYTRGVYSWHRNSYGVFELGKIADTLIEILTHVSTTAHFRIVRYAQPEVCERSFRE